MLVLVRAFLPAVGGRLGLAAFVSVALLTAWIRASTQLRNLCRDDQRSLTLRPRSMQSLQRKMSLLQRVALRCFSCAGCSENMAAACYITISAIVRIALQV